MQVPRMLALLATAGALALDGVRAADEDSGSGSTTIYIIVGVVVLLFIGAAVYVWMRSRRRDDDMALGLDPGNMHPPMLSDSNGRGGGYSHGQSQSHGQGGRHHSSQGQSHGPSLNGGGYRSHESPAVGRAPPPYQQQQQPTPYQPDNRYAPRSGGGGPPPPPPRQAPPSRPPPQARPAANNNNGARNAPRGTGGGPKPGSKSSEVAARVLAEFQTDAALCRRKIPYAALYFTRVLSKGAFGEVWLAQLENRQVAVKRILNEKKNDEKEIECFAAEIKLMASFYHPKIVEFVGVSWSTLQDLCAVTEYMAKGDLYGFLKRKNGQLNWRDHKIYLAEDVADALGYLHSLTPKVIHRDLKSKNILLDDTFRAKLSDFGISRERSLEETMTAGVGTIYWTAPEVLMGKKYTEKADIYSFGICMSELDTHEVPYSDMRDEAGKKLQGMKIVQQVIKKKLRPSFSTACPETVQELAMRCLDGEPDARPDANELLHLIQVIQQKL